MSADLLDTEREGHCPICGDPLDPLGYAAKADLDPRYIFRALFWKDNIKWNKCGSCRRFVPDPHRALANFWKELNEH